MLRRTLLSATTPRTAPSVTAEPADVDQPYSPSEYSKPLQSGGSAFRAAAEEDVVFLVRFESEFLFDEEVFA